MADLAQLTAWRDALPRARRYRGHLRVKSESYEAQLEPTILELLDTLDTGPDATD